MSDKYKELLEKIDRDKGLASKRKTLIIVSLIILAIQFSGAKVVEANTFILKLSFSHQNGIALLLCASVLFLLVRYYNYARPYHQELFELWSSRLLKEGFLYSFDYHDQVEYGLIASLAEKKLGMDLMHFRVQNHHYISWKYNCTGLFSRSVIFSIANEYDIYDEEVSLFSNVDFCDYLKILRHELRYQITCYLTHRENLDIYTPYCLGMAATLSYAFSSQLATLLTQLINFTQ